MRDDKTRKTNNSFEKHRRQIKRSNRLKRVSIVHQFYEASLIAILPLMFPDGLLKSITTKENIINSTMKRLSRVLIISFRNFLGDCLVWTPRQCCLKETREGREKFCLPQTRYTISRQRKAAKTTQQNQRVGQDHERSESCHGRRAN